MAGGPKQFGLLSFVYEIEQLAQVDGAFAEVAAAAEGIVGGVKHNDLSDVSQHSLHFFPADEAFGIEGDQQKIGRCLLTQVEEGFGGLGILVVCRAMPVVGDTRYGADFFGDRFFIVVDEVEHEVVGAVGVLVIGGVNIGDIDLVHLSSQHVGIGGSDRKGDFIIAEDGEGDFDGGQDTGKSIKSVTYPTKTRSIRLPMPPPTIKATLQVKR